MIQLLITHDLALIMPLMGMGKSQQKCIINKIFGVCTRIRMASCTFHRWQYLI